MQHFKSFLDLKTSFLSTCQDIVMCWLTNLHGVRYGQACVGWRDLITHEDNEKCDSSDKSNADEVQTYGQPAHPTTEEEVGGLVGVQ